MICFGSVHRFGVGRGDADETTVVDVDLDAGLFDDGADLFAAGTDDDADLAWLDLHGFDARRVDRHFLLWIEGRLRAFCAGCESALLSLARELLS